MGVQIHSRVQLAELENQPKSASRSGQFSRARRLQPTVMSILSSACRSLTGSLRAPLSGPLSTSLRYASSSAGGSSSSEVAPAGQSVKDLVPEARTDLVQAEVISGAPRALKQSTACVLVVGRLIISKYACDDWTLALGI